MSPWPRLVCGSSLVLLGWHGLGSLEKQRLGVPDLVLIIRVAPHIRGRLPSHLVVSGGRRLGEASQGEKTNFKQRPEGCED